VDEEEDVADSSRDLDESLLFIYTTSAPIV
jgi:hypothetical protein